MNESKLLPCPFCGGSADFVRATRGFGVYAGCSLCQACVFAIDEDNPSDVANHQKLASAAWNKRVAIPRATTQPFTPDWSLLEATQDSLRGHIAALKAAQEREQQFREQVAAALRELRARIASERVSLTPENAAGYSRDIAEAENATVELALQHVDATIAALGLGDQGEERKCS